MGLYIKGMGMPKGCDVCLLGDIVCGYDEDHIDRDCPLIEVPEPHGRLIDADKALDELFRDKREAYTKHSVWLMFSIHGAPTVIESEVEE